MKRAFTLVELLVVVSIVSMLASIVIASTASVQAKGRDSKRTQVIHQIDLATRLYIEDKGYAPLAGGPDTSCSVQAENPTDYEEVSACFKVSSDSSGWSGLASALSNYIKLPSDPCPSCSPNSTYPIGYTYVAPLAMQYFCAQSGTCTADDRSYQVYAPLERQATPTGGGTGSSGTYFQPPAAPGNPPETVDAPTSFVATSVGGYGGLFGNGSQSLFYLFAYKTVNGSRVYSPYSYTYFTEPPTSSAYHIHFTWDAVSGAEGYRIVIGQDDNFGYSGLHYIDLVSTGYYYGLPYRLFNQEAYGSPTNLLLDAVPLNPMVPALPVPPPPIDD